jgi:signal transduction histidine kinase
VGIPAESLPHVFEPGFSTTPHGSGLGLVIARKIVTDHDGLLSIESEPGVGTLVSIHLPIATDGDSPPDPARGPRTREGIVA